MAKKKKYLPLYKKWSKKGMLPSRNGLCTEFGVWSSFLWDFNEHPLFLLMTPEPYKRGGTTYFASHPDESWCFNPLRQNIVLLMAALNGEL